MSNHKISNPQKKNGIRDTHKYNLRNCSRETTSTESTWHVLHPEASHASLATAGVRRAGGLFRRGSEHREASTWRYLQKKQYPTSSNWQRDRTPVMLTVMHDLNLSDYETKLLPVAKVIRLLWNKLLTNPCYSSVVSALLCVCLCVFFAGGSNHCFHQSVWNVIAKFIRPPFHKFLLHELSYTYLYTLLLERKVYVYGQYVMKFHNSLFWIHIFI